jgi:two-component system LytT family response regulator
MKSAEDELDPERFMRIHRSTIVAVDRIASVSRKASGHIVRLTTGVRLRTSRQYAARVRALLSGDRR